MAEKKFLDAEGVKHLWDVTRLQNNENFQTNLEIFEAMAQVLETKEPKEDASKKLEEAKEYAETMAAGVAAAAVQYTDEKVAPLATQDQLLENYKKSVIALQVDGTTVTYYTGDGQAHTFETQDTNTTYQLATDEVSGITKLYAVTGSAEDGTMTQKAITDELNKKVGASVDEQTGTLVFTI